MFTFTGIRTEEYRTTDDLFKSADLVIVGTVSSDVSYLMLKPSLSSELTDEQRERLSRIAMPISVTGVIADEVLKGDRGVTAQLVDVMQFGGEGHGIANSDVAGVSHLVPDTRVVLFLSKYTDPKGEATEWYVILGVEDGMMLLDGESLAIPRGSESALVDVPTTLQELKSRFSK